ncbi:copper resistance protein CopC [Metabacillus herbersteinensis]|uniref:Copper resistance protein CopC n=1 Tax=Metabacillus herbersteinensis TaxID=283816 RepID=A0ABV6GEP1_9BACI
MFKSKKRVVYMKLFLSMLFLFLFLTFPNATNAHTYLKDSTPAEGEVVKEDLKEINLQFETKIESLSKMKLLIDGVEIPLSVEVNESEMIGTLEEQIENGAYLIQWDIVGEDGHPISGEVSFTVEKDEVEEEKVEGNSEGEESTTEEDENTSTENEDNSTEDEQSAPTETEGDLNEQTENNETVNESSGIFTTLLIVVLAVILIAGILLVFKKKR